MQLPTHRSRPAPAVALAVVAGVCGAVQPKINAVLGARLGSSLVASLVNFGVALLIVVVALILRPATRRKLVGLRSWPVPRWTLTAGIGGVVVVVGGAVTVERLGVAVFSVAFVAGQITCALIVDRLGVAPGGHRPITAARIQAACLAVCAILLAQSGRAVGDLAPALVAFAIAAGAGIAFQSAFNGRIASATGDPVAATAINVAVGTAALVGVVGALAVVGRLHGLQWPTEPWLYLGGVLGVTIVVSTAIAASALGVLRSMLAMLAAQFVGAFLVDWTLEDTRPSAGVVGGALLIIGAVTLVGRRASGQAQVISSRARR